MAYSTTIRYSETGAAVYEMDVPHSFLARLKGAEITLTVDQTFAVGRAVMILDPPQAFATRVATAEASSVWVKTAAGHSGGKMELRVNPADRAAIYQLNTSNADVHIEGTQDTPLEAGAVEAYSTGDGRVYAEYVHASGNVALRHADNVDHVVRGPDVTGLQVIVEERVIA